VKKFRKGDIMKKKFIPLALAVFSITAYVSCPDVCQWPDYLGNTQRTGYSTCSGPDVPVELWRADFPGEFDTPPFIIDDKVVILLRNPVEYPWKSKVLVLDLVTGKVLHKSEVETDEPFFKIFPVGDKILGISGLELYEIDLSSEKVDFLVPFAGKTFGGSLIYPVVLKDKIVLPTTPALCLSRPDFSVTWELSQLTFEKDLTPLKLAGDETLAVFIVSPYEGYHILFVDPSTGSLKWQSDLLPSASWLALGEGVVYCGGRNLWAFDRKGSALWEFEPEDYIVSNIVVSPDSVYIGDAAQNLYRIDLNGKEIWKTEGEIYSLCTDRGTVLCCDTFLIGAGDFLYCVGSFEDQGSVITAYRTEDGSKVWRFQFEIPEPFTVPPFGQIRAPPATANGILVLGTMTGEIIAFASDPDLYEKQGDAFLDAGKTENAITSYEKAVELYKKKGDESHIEEIQQKIEEIENSLTTPPPETTPPETSPPPKPSTPLSLFVLIITGILSGIFIVYFLIKRKE
jgi:outer membrane protein assembly factor BamB